MVAMYLTNDSKTLECIYFLNKLRIEFNNCLVGANCN